MMMEQVLWGLFSWILSTSGMASVLVVLVLLLKYGFRERLTAVWHYVLWLLVLIRLILPWAPATSISVYNLFSLEKQVVFQVEPAVENVSPSILPANTSPGNGETFGVAPGVTKPGQGLGSAENSPVGFKALALIWLLGVIALATHTFAVNRRFARRIQAASGDLDHVILQAFASCKRKMGVRADIPLVMTSQVQSPTLFGLLRPRILLPLNVTETLTVEQLSHVFLHELAHFKRRDVAVNWLMHLLLVLHWFNPLLWYAFYRMRQDQELACDASVLSRMNPGEAREYGYTVLRVLESLSANPWLVTSLAGVSGTKSEARRRITMIRLFGKGPGRWSLAGVIVVVLLAAFALTNARAGAPATYAADNASSHSLSSPGEVKPLPPGPANAPAAPVNLATMWNLEERKMHFTRQATPAGASADSIVPAARELLGAEGEKAMVAAVEYGQLTDAATPRIDGIALSNLPVWLVSFDGISIPAVNGYIFTKALVVVDAETGQPLMMLQ